MKLFSQPPPQKHLPESDIKIKKKFSTSFPPVFHHPGRKLKCPETKENLVLVKKFSTKSIAIYYS
jgi:hypothetical protein